MDSPFSPERAPMKPSYSISLPVLAVSAFSLCLMLHQPLRAAEEADTVEVRARDITLNVPKHWEQEGRKSRLRLTQFRVPAIEDDEEDAELAVFSFGASDIEGNIRRWISQFEAEGRRVKISMGDQGQGKYVLVNISGTYQKPVGPPIEGRTEPAPGSRVVAVILVVPQTGVYYFKLVGPDKTVAANADHLRRSFGGDASKEKEIKAPEAAQPESDFPHD